MKKAKYEYTRTYRSLILRMVPGAVCSKESTAQLGTVPHRRARHGTARHYSWAELSWERIFCDSTVLNVARTKLV